MPQLRIVTGQTIIEVVFTDDLSNFANLRDLLSIRYDVEEKNLLIFYLNEKGQKVLLASQEDLELYLEENAKEELYELFVVINSAEKDVFGELSLSIIEKLPRTNTDTKDFDELLNKVNDPKSKDEMMNLIYHELKQMKKSNEEKFQAIEEKQEVISKSFINLSLSKPNFNKQDSKNSQNTGQSGITTVHANIKCDECKNFPIIGKRFKCMVCRYYDLCEVCEAQNIHDHDMVRIVNPINSIIMEDKMEDVFTAYNKKITIKKQIHNSTVIRHSNDEIKESVKVDRIGGMIREHLTGKKSDFEIAREKGGNK